MQVIRDLNTAAFPGQRTVITIGAYDGVHAGHREVIARVRARAEELGAKSVVVTFDKHPAWVVRPESAPKLLTSNEQKLELLEATGVDATVLVPFDDHASHEKPEDFVKRVLVNCLAVRAVVVGEDFHFGYKRSGNVPLLSELGMAHDFEVEPVPLINRGDGVAEPVSSTSIRRALAGGQVVTATEMLGHHFEAVGTVVKGDQRGRTIGFPTANVEVASLTCLPADGVYAGLYERPNGEVHPCAINLGRRPTFYDAQNYSLLEAHLIGFDGNLYSELAKVRFVDFLRSERKFDGIDSLKAQLMQDIEHAKQALNA